MKKRRGPNKGLTKKDGPKLKVVISHVTNRPMDPTICRKLSRQCTIVAKTLVPIKGKESWKAITPEEKEPLYKQLEVKLNITLPSVNEFGM